MSEQDETTEQSTEQDGSGSLTGHMFEGRPHEPVGVERRAGLGRVLQSVLQAEEEVTRVGRFEIRDRIGHGAMGIVYRAWDPQLERLIALKVLAHSRSDRRDEIVAEARMLARLADPNVVTVHETGEVDGDAYVAMELVDGLTLRRWIRRNREAGREAVLDLFRQAGQGLAAAHRAGVVHRDFKPDNVIVGADGRVRVIDFGLALSDEEDRPEEVVGTRRYMSPEQRAGQPVDARSDQYSYCVAVWLALAPKTEPGGEAPTIPGGIRRVLTRGLAERPEDRWPSMDALLEALPRRRRVPRSTVALAGVLGVGLLGVLAWPEEEPPPPPALPELCPDGRPQLDTAWGPGRQRAVARAFAMEGRSEAETGFAHLRQRLDRHADAWVEAQGRACQLSHGDSVEDVARGKARLACLQEVRGTLEWFTGQIPDLEPKERGQLALAFLTLPTVDDCDDPNHLIASPAAHQDLVRAVAQGEVAATLLRLDAAHETLVAAHEEATRRKVDRVAAAAAGHLSSVERNRGNTDEARAWADRSLAAAERLGDADLMVQAWLQMAAVATKDKDLDRTAFAVERARNLQEQLPADSQTRGQILWDAADLAFDRREHEAAVAGYREAVAELERTGAATSAALAQCDSINPLIELGKLDEAFTASEGCVDRLTSVHGPLHPRLHFPLAQATNLALIAGDNEKGMALGERTLDVWRLAEGIDPGQKASVFALVAGVANELEDYEKGDALLDEALEMLAATGGEPSPANIIVRTQYGASLTHRGKCEAAMEHYQAVVDAFDGRKDAPADQMTIVHMNKAECEAQLGRREDALRSIARGLELSPHEPGTLMHTKKVQHDGEIRRLAGDLKGARKRLEKVVAVAEAQGMSEGDRAYAHYLLARTLADQGKRDAALAQIERARPLFDAGGDENPARKRAFEAWMAEYVGAPG